MECMKCLYVGEGLLDMRNFCCGKKGAELSLLEDSLKKDSLLRQPRVKFF